MQRGSFNNSYVNMQRRTLLLLGGIIGCIFWFNIRGKSPDLAASPALAASPDRAASLASDPLSNVVEEVKIWKKSEAKEIASEILLDVENDKVTKDIVKLEIGDQSVTVSYRENTVKDPKLDVLLLHGAFYKSENWVSTPLWTLQILGRLGYRGVAIDLPGYGDSPSAAPSQAEFIETLIDKLDLYAPIIVSPSMSGSYSLPYLFKDPDHVLSRSRGFVPLAPVGTDGYTAEQYQALQIPTLIIFGEKDIKLGHSSTLNLKILSNHVIVKLKDAGHSCYIDNPYGFHKHLIHFLGTLEEELEY